MIQSWSYNNLEGLRPYVKELIKKNNYRAIDVGASANPWSYPECNSFIDIISPNKDNVNFFKLNLENEEERNEFLKIVEKDGKFDFSICSHTIEDIFNPIDVIKFLMKISKRGYISIPSKYNEFKKLYNNLYRGNAHHKQFFDIQNNKIVIFPKFSFIETDNRSDEILRQHKDDELNIFWEDDVEFKIFGDVTPYNGDNSLISDFYKQLIDENN